MAGPDQVLATLQTQLGSYKERFLDHHLNASPLANPSDYELDVRAYIVLAHAGFEEFYEELVLGIAQAVYQAWITSRRFTVSTGLLIATHGKEIEIESKKGQPPELLFDKIRKSLEKAVACVSALCNDKANGNHGISPRNLRNLLIPVGIDFRPDVQSLNAITKLSADRGDFAHKSSMRTVLTPEGALEIVGDNLTFALQVVAQAKVRLSEFS